MAVRAPSPSLLRYFCRTVFPVPSASARCCALARPCARPFSTSPSRRSHENPLGLPGRGPQGQGLPQKETSRNPNLAARMARGLPEKRRIRGVRKVVAVSSAKGGVGKSTIAANLALAFTKRGHRTGILDTDIFGPSIPTLFNLLDSPPPELTPNNLLLPLTSMGVSTMSMGYLIPSSSPTVWRGPMLVKGLQQLLHEVAWNDLDVLVLDLPPGTGDVQLTIAQQIEMDGVVVVSTPQQLSWADVSRGVGMFERMGTRVLGLVRNMSFFVCPGCEERHYIFGGDPAVEGGGGVLQACREKGIELLGDIPVDGGICRDADRGVPSVMGDPEGGAAKAFLGIARDVRERIGL